MQGLEDHGNMRRPSLTGFLIRMLAALGLCMAVLWVASCSERRESDQQIRQQAQQSTERAKAAAQQAAADAKVAAQNAARDAKDIAFGVKAGLHDKTATHLVDVNSAGLGRLETLPGVDGTVARRIEARRPYARSHDLVRKGAVSEHEYQRIAGDVTAG